MHRKQSISRQFFGLWHLRNTLENSGREVKCSNPINPLTLNLVLYNPFDVFINKKQKQGNTCTASDQNCLVYTWRLGKQEFTRVKFVALCFSTYIYLWNHWKIHDYLKKIYRVCVPVISCSYQRIDSWMFSICTIWYCVMLCPGILQQTHDRLVKLESFYLPLFIYAIWERGAQKLLMLD